jgi:hypothetical protein
MPEGLQALEILEGAAIFAFGLDLIAQEQRPGVGSPVAGHALEAIGEGVVAVLGFGDFDIAMADEVLGHGDEELARGVEGVVEATGEEAGFEACDAEDGLLGEGDALDGEQLLGVGGLVDGDKIGAEVRDFLEVFEADDGESGGGEAVLAGVLGGAGLAPGGAGTGGVSGIGAIGGELFGGDWFSGVGHKCASPKEVARARARVRD